jgi:hypothetical protein
MRSDAVRFFPHQCSICIASGGHVVKVPHLLALGFSIKGVLDEVSESHGQAVIAGDYRSSALRVAIAAIRSFGDLPKWRWVTRYWA